MAFTAAGVEGAAAGAADRAMLGPIRNALVVLLGLAVAASLASVSRAADQETFRSPEAALQALLRAVRTDNPADLKPLFGPDSDDLLSSGDAVADRAGLKHFANRLNERTHLEHLDDHTVVIHAGKDGWPLAIPIVKEGDGWKFDTASGTEEIINRRIGRNELTTIDVLRAIVDAEREYSSQDRTGVGARTYAARILSDPGKHDGLYWEDPGGKNPSPIGPLVAKASTEGYATERKAESSPSPYHGYVFKMLTAQGPQAPGGEKSYLKDGRLTGGFATVAYPIEYGVSGVMTFVVNQQGIVFQKDLGQKTGELAPAIMAYNPDDSWQPVKN